MRGEEGEYNEDYCAQDSAAGVSEYFGLLTRSKRDLIGLGTVGKVLDGDLRECW